MRRAINGDRFTYAESPLGVDRSLYMEKNDPCTCCHYADEHIEEDESDSLMPSLIFPCFAIVSEENETAQRCECEDYEQNAGER